MPGHKSHQLFGIGLSIVLLILLFLWYPNDLRTIARVALVGFVFCFLGSIMPDVDEKHSVIFKHVRFFIFIIFFIVSYSAMFGQYPKNTPIEMLYVLGVSALIGAAAVLFFYSIVPEHRAGIHSVLAGVIYAVFACLCTYVLLHELWLVALIGIFAFLAYCSHLLLDRSIK